MNTVLKRDRETTSEQGKKIERSDLLTSEHSNKIMDLEKDFQNNRKNYQPQIYVTSVGQANVKLDIAVPKFHGRELNPIEHLR